MIAVYFRGVLGREVLKKVWPLPEHAAHGVPVWEIVDQPLHH